MSFPEMMLCGVCSSYLSVSTEELPEHGGSPPATVGDRRASVQKRMNERSLRASPELVRT